MRFRNFRQSILIRGVLLMRAPAAFSQGPPPVYPVKLSASGPYLVDQNNRPYFINGESAWAMLAHLSKADADLYMENRRQKGFNAVLTMLINHAFASNAPANFYRDQPFTTPGNFNTPNEAYFAHADWVINTAAAKGQVVILAPVYLGWSCGVQGWCGEIRNSSLTTMRNWGRYVGNRYKDFPNIIWVIGGDADPNAQGVADKLTEFVAGLREFDTNHLITAHNAHRQSAFSQWPTATWLTLNSIYTDNITYTPSADEYNRAPTKTFFLIESYYENEHGSTPVSLRSEAYWTLLSGGTAGHIFGGCPLSTFSTYNWEFCPTGPQDWRTQLETPGGTTVPLIGRLVSSRAFHSLVPDLSHQTLTAGFQSGATYATAARTTDGSTVIAYIPTQRAVAINMTRIAGTSAKMWWFNPRTGTSSAIGTFATTGTQTLTPPDSNDWVLVADNAALNLPPPGTGGSTPTPAAPTNLRIVK